MTDILQIEMVQEALRDRPESVTARLAEEVRKLRMVQDKREVPSFSELKQALANIMDGQYTWYEIKEQTGLSDDRCKEMEKIAMWALGVG